MEHKKNVATAYDWSSKAFEILLGGDHLHNGFYDPNADPPKTMEGHREAQERMMEEALRLAGFSDDEPEKWPKNIVDVGCGLGGSSRYLAKKYGARCQGFTLSPYQARRAAELTAAQGLAHKVSFQVADATDQPFSDGQFDLVWTLECLEHVNEKKKFMSEMARVAAPGGRIAIMTFCRRPLGPSEESLQKWEKQILEKFADIYHLAQEWYSVDDYVKLLESCGLQDVKTLDVTQNIGHYTPAVVRAFFSWRGLAFLWYGGLQAIKSARGVPVFLEGHKKGLIKVALITCRKPK